MKCDICKKEREYFTISDDIICTSCSDIKIMKVIIPLAIVGWLLYGCVVFLLNAKQI